MNQHFQKMYKCQFWLFLYIFYRREVLILLLLKIFNKHYVDIQQGKREYTSFCLSKLHCQKKFMVIFNIILINSVGVLYFSAPHGAHQSTKQRIRYEDISLKKLYSSPIRRRKYIFIGNKSWFRYDIR